MKQSRGSRKREEAKSPVPVLFLSDDAILLAIANAEVREIEGQLMPCIEMAADEARGLSMAILELASSVEPILEQDDDDEGDDDAR